MDHLKYIVVLSRGLECPILFPALLDHADVAGGFHGVISAGFASFRESEEADGEARFSVSCWGKSTTLEANPRPGRTLADFGDGFSSRPDEDAALIKRELERPHRY